MGDIKGFLKVKREKTSYRPVGERIKDYKEIPIPRPETTSQEQASRCMDCGTPFCHWGCSLANVIPEWNDLLYRGQWEKALRVLQSTNNFPEITARICPNTCEYACVLGINDEPVTIRENELAIIEYGFKNGLIRPNPPEKRTRKKIAIIGSGPAGLACADQLNKAGHRVTVFEKDDKIGGILRYGIPDFKLEKWIIDRRLKILEKEGVIFKTNKEIKKIDPVRNRSPQSGRSRAFGMAASNGVEKGFDAVCLAIGSRESRDLKVEGRDLKGIYFAMDYLTKKSINAKGKHVVIIGGGDTGADCVGTAHRQDARSVTQIEILPQPPESRTEAMPWPTFPAILKTSTSHEEGGERKWSIQTKRFIGTNGKVNKIICESNGKEFELKADLVILAMGFVHPVHKGLVINLGLSFDSRGNIKTDENYMTSKKGFFSAGDCHRGASLVVWAIMEGRQAARSIDAYLMGRSLLPGI